MKIIKYIFLFWLIIAVMTGIFQYAKILPKGFNLEGLSYNVYEDNIALLSMFPKNTTGQITLEKYEIYNKILQMIDQAQAYILIDSYLFGTDNNELPYVYKTFLNKIIEKKQKNHNIIIQIITDPINTFYRKNDVLPDFQILNQNGINIITTDIDKLRDSSIIYSALWRTLLQWFGIPNTGQMDNPIKKFPEKISFRSYLKYLNFKSNRRAIVLTDNGLKISALVTSAYLYDSGVHNPHIAFYFESENWRDIYESERVVAELSQQNFSKLNEKYFDFTETTDETKKAIGNLQVFTENKIKKIILRALNGLEPKDSLSIVTSQLSDRDIIQSLINTAKKNVNINMILNHDKKSKNTKQDGLPNQAVAQEMLKKSENKIKIRWLDISDNQPSAKLLLINKIKNPSILILGTANFSKKDMEGFNLNTMIQFSGTSSTAPIMQANKFFDALWNNTDGSTYTVEYEKHKNTSYLKYLLYRFLEWSGLSNF